MSWKVRWAGGKEGMGRRDALKMAMWGAEDVDFARMGCSWELTQDMAKDEGCRSQRWKTERHHQSPENYWVQIKCPAQQAEDQDSRWAEQPYSPTRIGDDITGYGVWCYSKCSHWTRSTHIVSELAKNSISQSPPHPWIRICILTRYPGICIHIDVYRVLKGWGGA